MHAQRIDLKLWSSGGLMKAWLNGYSMYSLQPSREKVIVSEQKTSHTEFNCLLRALIHQALLS